MLVKNEIRKTEKNDRAGKKDAAPAKPGSQIVVEIIEYIPDSTIAKTIIKKSPGNLSIMSLDSIEELTEKTSPFETFVQIIEGKSWIVIDKVSHLLEPGQGIAIPAHSPHSISADGRFKMISTVVRSDYE
ncbi:MAG: cupin domain-containing protein [Puia sp.]|nr:cupin domain-containing protein [Puia sp.]